MNLQDNQIEVCTDPTGPAAPGYAVQSVFGPAQDVPVVVAGQEVGRIPARDLLP